MASDASRVSHFSPVNRWRVFGAVISLMAFGLVAGCKPAENAADAGAPPGGATTPAASGETIKIGHYASMTGDQSTFGNETDNGIKLAIKELNAKGGDLGRQFELETQDDQSKPDEARTVAVKFAADPKIVAVLGEVQSTLSKNAAPVFQKASIPMVSPSSTNPDVTKIGDYIFRVCFIDPFQGAVMAQFAANELKVKKVAIMRSQSSDYSIGLAEVFTENFKKLGGEIVADVSYNPKDTEFRSQLSQIKGKSPDAIYIPGYYGEVGTIARQAREQGVTVPLMGGDGWDSAELVKGAGGPGKALEGCYFSNHYSKDDASPRVQTFVKAYKADNGGTAPSGLAALGYDAMMIVADAIKRAGSTDHAKIKDALAQTKAFPGVTGDITIDQNRNASKSAVVLQIKGDEFVYKTTVKPTN